MANESGSWELKTTVEPNQVDLDHIAEMVKQGYTSGEVVKDEIDPCESCKKCGETTCGNEWP